MLNRRTLRIKAMQMLFAYLQAKISNYYIGIEHIGEVFSIDMDSMDEQDPVKLKKQKEESVELFEESFKNKTPAASKSGDPEVTKTTNETIQLVNNQINKDFEYCRSLMLQQVEEIPKIYYSILELLLEFRKFAEQDRIKPACLVKNLLIEKIKRENSLHSIILSLEINWKPYLDQISGWYKEFKSSAKFNESTSKKKADFEQDRDMVVSIIKEIIFNDELTKAFWEEFDINWAENKAVVKSMVLKTIKETKENGKLKLAELSYNWEEDRSFFDLLFTKSVEEAERNEEIIVSKIKNWDIERIAVTDKAILLMAMAEMTNFPSIPVKVTINEYIEISKKYSTPKSKQFVNGVLDVLAKDLSAEGLIKKSGRGLLDNK